MTTVWCSHKSQSLFYSPFTSWMLAYNTHLHTHTYIHTHSECSNLLASNVPVCVCVWGFVCGWGSVCVLFGVVCCWLCVCVCESAFWSHMWMCEVEYSSVGQRLR